MKTKYNSRRRSHPRTRAERALTLAVLTALLSGAAATPVMAKDVTIEEGKTVEVHDYSDNKVGLTYKDSETEEATDTNNITNSPSGNTLTILGTVDASVGDVYAWITPAYSGGDRCPI